MRTIFQTITPLRAFTALGVILLFTACGNDPKSAPNNDAMTKTMSDSASMTAKNTLESSSPKPIWAPTITNRMQAIIEKLVSYGGQPVENATPADARRGRTPTDAVMDLVKENQVPMPLSMVDTMGKDIPVAGGMIHARIYTPKSGTGPFPVIVYYRGGGWVIASLDVYDASARGLAEQANAVVVSVDYRMAPEHKFPTAHNDAYAAYEWVLKNAASIKGDPKRIAVAGESAGGNMACVVSMMARDKRAMLPLHQILVYPVANDDMNAPSMLQYAQAKPLNKAMMGWFAGHYFRTPADGKSPMISLVNANLKGLPPTTIIAAQIDPLASGGMMLADKLKAAGVATMYKNYDGVTHEFFGMAILLPEAKAAQALAAGELKKAFGK